MKLLITILLTLCLTVAVSTNATAGPLPGPVTDQDYVKDGVIDFPKAALGRLLFFDKIMSGNRNISCGTCHHVFTNTADGVSLPSGEGATGLSVLRDTGEGPDAIDERIPRNALAIFNKGAREFTTLFHDGRLTLDPSKPSGFDSPAGDDLPNGLDNMLAAVAMFPVTSTIEMAGQQGENEIANAAEAGQLTGATGVWQLVANRVAAIPGYVTLFQDAYSDVQQASDITYVHIANAIAEFEIASWRADNSPFDRFLRGDTGALSDEAKLGMDLFYGKAGCDVCHSGKFQSDQDFHAIGMPQIGPGNGDSAPGYNDGHDDFGRENVTGDPADRYKFRTPSLRNVELTAPYGHSGAYGSLENVVLHHLYPQYFLFNYDATQAVLPFRQDLDVIDFDVVGDANRLIPIDQAKEPSGNHLEAAEFNQIIVFLRSLTDPGSVNIRSDIPAEVPSGLPVND